MTESTHQAAIPVTSIALHLIAVNPNQARRHFDEDKLAELAESIRDIGLVQPIVVRPRTVVGDDVLDFELIAGERRLRAGRLAGMEALPAIIRSDLTTADIAVMHLVENLQRENLSLAETIDGCAKLVEQIGLDAAAKRLGKSLSWVSQRATLVKASARVQDLVARGLIDDVEIAHGIDTIAELDADLASQMIESIQSPNEWEEPVTRDEIRQAIKNCKAAAEREERRKQEAARETAIREQQAAKAKAAQKGLPIEPKDEKQIPPPPKKENQWEREQRLRAEAWVALEGDCRKLYRDARKDVITALEECLGSPKGEAQFQLVMGMPEYYTSRDAPAKATGAEYKVEIRGDSGDAGLLLDALKPGHEISVHIHPTIAQLRQIEVILGKPLAIRETFTVKGSVIGGGAAGTRVRAAHAALTGQKANTQDQITPPASIDKTVPKFLKACTQRRPGERVKASDLHAAYVAFCERHRLEPMPLNGDAGNSFGAAIAAAGIEKIRSNGFRYVDLQLLVDAEAA